MDREPNPQAHRVVPQPRSCEHAGCGEPFQPRRSDARYCSDACRAAASRARRRGRRSGERPRGHGSLQPSSCRPASVDAAQVLPALVSIEHRLAALENLSMNAEAFNGLRSRLEAVEALVLQLDAVKRSDETTQQREDRRHRQFDTALEDLRVRVDDLEEAAGATSSGSDGPVADLEGRVRSLETETEAAADAIGQVWRNHRALRDDVARLATSIAGFAETVTPGRWRS